MREQQDTQSSNFLPVATSAREDFVRGRFWRKFRGVIGRIPFSEDVLAAYYCAIDKMTPRKVKLILFAALAYFIVPTDLVPDFLIHVGFVDDAAVLAAAFAAIGGAIKERHREQAHAFFDRPQ